MQCASIGKMCNTFHHIEGSAAAVFCPLWSSTDLPLTVVSFQNRSAQHRLNMCLLCWFSLIALHRATGQYKWQVCIGSFEGWQIQASRGKVSFCFLFLSNTQAFNLSISVIPIPLLYQSRSFPKGGGRKWYGLTNSGKEGKKMYLSVKQEDRF